MCAAALHLVLTKYHVKHEFEWHSALLAELPSEQLDWIIKLPSNATLWSAVCVCLGTLTPGFSTPLHADCIQALIGPAPTQLGFHWSRAS